MLVVNLAAVVADVDGGNAGGWDFGTNGGGNGGKCAIKGGKIACIWIFFATFAN